MTFQPPTLVDANVILRYLVGDGGDLAQQARDIIEYGNAYTYPEVLAEVVYVLSGVYGVSRQEVCTAYRALGTHMIFYDPQMLLCAFNLYELSPMDFVDCLLAARSLVQGEALATFDKQLAHYTSRS